MRAEAVEIELSPKGPFSLAASRTFLEGFTPASGSAAATDDGLLLAFRLDRTFEAVGAILRQPKIAVLGIAAGAKDGAAVQKQVARILSLDHDARGWARLGKDDPVAGRLQAWMPGFRPPCFPSPYEAAVWGLIAHRIQMTQAATIKRRIAQEHGDVVRIEGHEVVVFPGPAKLLSMKRPASVPEEKWTRLQGVARATMEGLLDADVLRDMPVDDALERLHALRGVGSWTAGHILLRGSGTADVPALDEPRVRRAAMIAYELEREPSAVEMVAISDRWRPFRTWMSVLLAFHLNRTGQWNTATGERGGRPRRSAPKRG